MKKILIFTDLDGTLLDAKNYEYTKAQRAIDVLKERGIPIIPCTSKTHLEVAKLQKRIGILDPFIVENGSAIFTVQNYFKITKVVPNELDGYHVLILGRNYKDIIQFFKLWKNRHNLNATGFHEMNTEQIMELTDLNMIEAELAKQRFFSEPFILKYNDEISKSGMNDINKNGFRLLRGNRFYHLLGNSDKGAAVKKLVSFYMNKWSTDSVTTIGIGDSMNDLEMLKAVMHPVLVKKPDGFHQSGIDIKNIMHTAGIGPAGWQEAVFKILDVS
jgi:mannosyl-3-phosphoglycerate phosphatase